MGHIPWGPSFARDSFAHNERRHVRWLLTLLQDAIWQRAFPALLLPVFCAVAGAAQDLAPPPSLPQMRACTMVSHPRLPERWRGAYLMAPFNTAQLVLGEITSDATLAAMRVKLYGIRGGATDFLITGDNTYELVFDGTALKECRNLGDTGWRPLPRDWLSRRSQCAGSAAVGETPADWWKTPIEPAPSSLWIWYKTSDHTPFRLIFEQPSNRLAVLSQYALSYQVSFEPMASSDLAPIKAVCSRTKPAPGDGASALRQRIEAMARSTERADAEIGRLMPALRPSCPATAPPHWPEKFGLYGFMTPNDANENPAALEVLYDWSVPGQRSRIFSPRRADVVPQDALLLSSGGYNVTHRRGAAPFCSAGLPGPLRPDWQARANCECAAQIEAGTPLSPYGAARIMACHFDKSRAAWIWSTLDGRPMAFTVSSFRGNEGSGSFAVVDYRDWTPDQSFPASALDKPPQCAGKPSAHAGAPAAASHCASCHLEAAGQR